MYESRIEIPDQVEAATGDALASVAWPELVAKLAAQHDLRRILLSGERGPRASFNPMAANLLVGLGHSKRDVNPEGLVRGKYPLANAAPAAETEASADREN